MAEDLRSISVFPHFKNITAVTTLTEIQLPTVSRMITVGSDAAALYVCTVGGSDGGAVPADRAFVPQSQYFSVNTGTGDANSHSSIYVATQSGTGDTSIILEQNDG